MITTQLTGNMAASRKLQGEIERCMKKVIEGVETFQDIWQKVHNATNTNQKEKYEADLKKEIKKLQRLRDQIKTWIACAEIKDKSTLLENRRLIETQMERFKVIERETKTKAYSKEGLGAIQKMDPAQKEKEDVTGWLIHSIDILNFQVDQFESEIESLMVAGKKKRVDKDKQDKVEELKNKVEKHRFHTKKLETLLRMLDNMSVEVRQVKRLKEDVEYYIDASQDVDFQENEFMYDDIVGIDDVDLSAVAGGTAGDETETISTISGPSSPSPSSPTPTCDSAGSNPATTTALPTVTSSHSTTATSCAVYVSSTSSSSICSVTSSNSSNSEEPKKKEKAAKVTPVKPSKKEQHQATAVSSASTNSLNIKTVINHTSSVTIITTGVTTTSNVCTSTSLSSAPSPQPGNFATVAASNLNHNSGSNSSSKTTNSNIGNGSIIQQQSTVQPTENGPSSIVMNHVTENEPLVITTSSNECTNTDVVLSYTPVSSNSTTSLSSSAPSPTIDTNATLMTTIKNIPHDAIDLTSAVVVDVPNSENNLNCIPSTNGKPSSSSKKKDAHITPLLGVAPLGPVPLSKEIQHQFDMMESAFYHMPHPVDSERAKPYLSRIPATTPAYYNQVPLPNTDIIDFYHRLTTDTLFFIFYYMEGTKAQYLAAKALKKQSWRFHTKYLMWFQRHEEPKTINEEYEQGTYVYFDYEKWIQRRKEGFTFEYKYLEDRDLS